MLGVVGGADVLPIVLEDLEHVVGGGNDEDNCIGATKEDEGKRDDGPEVRVKDYIVGQNFKTFYEVRVDLEDR